MSVFTQMKLMKYGIWAIMIAAVLYITVTVVKIVWSLVVGFFKGLIFALKGLFRIKS